MWVEFADSSTRQIFVDPLASRRLESAPVVQQRSKARSSVLLPYPEFLQLTEVNLMKKTVAVILWLLLNTLPALCIQKPADWIKYTSPEGRYSVLLPAQPALSTQEGTSKEGQKFPQYLASVGDADLGYVTTYFDTLPGTTFSIDEARDALVSHTGSSLLAESSISLGNYHGREIKISLTADDGTVYIDRMRFYEVDKRIYMLQYLVPKTLESEALNAKGSRYLDSFGVLKN